MRGSPANGPTANGKCCESQLADVEADRPNVANKISLCMEAFNYSLWVDSVCVESAAALEHRRFSSGLPSIMQET